MEYRGRYNFRGHNYGGRGRGNYQQDPYQEEQYPQQRSQSRGGSRDRRNKPPQQRRGGGPSVTFNVPAAAVPLPTGPPVPQHLSKTESAEKNDPLYRESVFVDASQDLRPNPDNLSYYVGAEGFTEVVLQIHDEIKSNVAGFAKRVPLPVFQYYCAVLTWHRMLKLHQKNGFKTSFDEQDYIRIIDDASLQMPSPLAHYLNGMGNTTMPAGREVLFRLKERRYEESEEELIGWFGRVDAENHFLYRNYPCLAVFAKNIMQCIRLSHAERGDRQNIAEWDLPADMQPDEDDHGLPTPNMLGYSTAEQLSSEQLRFLHAVQFDAGVYLSSDSEVIPLFMGLMRSVQSEFNATSVFRLDPVSGTITGSQAQNLIVEVPMERRQAAVFGRAIPKCLTNLTSVVAYLGAAMKYRTLHDHTLRRRVAAMTSSVHSFQNFERVPVAWAATDNSMRDGESELYNQSQFSAVEFLIKNRVEKLIRGERVVK